MSQCFYECKALPAGVCNNFVLYSPFYQFLARATLALNFNVDINVKFECKCTNYYKNMLSLSIYHQDSGRDLKHAATPTLTHMTEATLSRLTSTLKCAQYSVSKVNSFQKVANQNVTWSSGPSGGQT